VDDGATNVCIVCATARAKWILDLTEAVAYSPCWDAFSRAYEKVQKCDKCKLSWSDHFRSYITKWKRKTLRDEEAIPDWPLLCADS
jgi:hypothetical protein